jgi:glycosyltransferase involved in cell wall biosynthesis
MTKVSIIAPTHNRSNFLKLAIESILRQDFFDFEIIVFDNASNDDTKIVVDGFVDPRIKYFRNPQNVGLLNNHNLALERCQGEFIHIFSDDDIMLPNCISSKVKILEDFPNINVVHSDIMIINDEGIVTDTNHWANFSCPDWGELHSMDREFSAAQYLEILYNQWNIISMPSVMIRKCVIDDCGGFQITPYSCDWLLWMKTCVFGDFYYINSKLVQYRFHERNVTHDGSVKRTIDDLYLMKLEVQNFVRRSSNNTEILNLVKNKITKSDVRLQVENPFGWIGSKQNNVGLIKRIIMLLRSIK